MTDVVQRTEIRPGERHFVARATRSGGVGGRYRGLAMDGRLSSGARGLGLYLLATYGQTSFDARALAREIPHQGHRRTRAYLAELEDARLLRRRIVRNARGQLVTQSIMVKDPELPDPFREFDERNPGKYQVAPKPHQRITGRPTVRAWVDNPPQRPTTNPLGDALSPHPGTVTRAGAASCARVCAPPRAGGNRHPPRRPQPHAANPDGPVPRPLPDLPEPRVLAEHTAQAAEALVELRRSTPRLTLSEYDVASLAPYAARWFARGVDERRFVYAMSAGLPDRVGDPAGILKWRLVHKLPPIDGRRPPVHTGPTDDLPRALPLPIFRVTYCPACRCDVPPQALDDGRCVDCRVAEYDTTHREGLRRVRAALSHARETPYEEGDDPSPADGAAPLDPVD